ncbi:MAG TPA: glycoside hydrolase family 88 protein [Bacteroidales bacterium]|nr:glycoside hydrolase family 88 protein [Bacteroidales bacterium]
MKFSPLTKLFPFAFCFTLLSLSACASKKDMITESKKDVIDIIHKVNQHWQAEHPYTVRAFWDNAAYHTGNMEAYFLTGNEAYREYSQKWAEHNEWKGAKSTDKSQWRYHYGENDLYVLFGDWQTCFQTYIDLYHIEPEEIKIERAKEVMYYQMSTENRDYWWWSDGLYMAMPVMTKLYKLTGDELFLEKMQEYYQFAEELMYDEEYALFFRDAKYVYPKEPTINGKKNFWSRGNGWVFAAYAKVMQDLPEDNAFRKKIEQRFIAMAASLKKIQQPEGYWTRSLLDPEHAPGPETSGTAFFTYAYFWGINNGLLDKKEYLPTAAKAWSYLSKTALQEDFTIGYVQPIGERAIPGQTVDARSTANFGVGAFLLAACELARYLD